MKIAIRIPYSKKSLTFNINFAYYLFNLWTWWRFNLIFPLTVFILMWLEEVFAEWLLIKSFVVIWIQHTISTWTIVSKRYYLVLQCKGFNANGIYCIWLINYSFCTVLLIADQSGIPSLIDGNLQFIKSVKANDKMHSSTKFQFWAKIADRLSKYFCNVLCFLPWNIYAGIFLYSDVETGTKRTSAFVLFHAHI